MEPINMGDDEGYVTFVLGETSIRLDLYETKNDLAMLFREVANGSQEMTPAMWDTYHKKCAEYMASKGFPDGLSSRAGSKFSDRVQEAMILLEKKSAGGVVSQGSMDSTLPTGHQEN